MQKKTFWSRVKEFMSADLLPEMNLRKKYPDYFNMWIIRGMWVVLLLMVSVEFVLNDNSFTAVYVECTDPQGCINPFLSCEYANGTRINMPSEIPMPQFTVDGVKTDMRLTDYDICHKDPPCPDGLCEKLYLREGDVYGRKGLGALDVLGVVLMTFVVNHLWYWRKKQNEKKN